MTEQSSYDLAVNAVTEYLAQEEGFDEDPHGVVELTMKEIRSALESVRETDIGFPSAESLGVEQDPNLLHVFRDKVRASLICRIGMLERDKGRIW